MKDLKGHEDSDYWGPSEREAREQAQAREVKGPGRLRTFEFRNALTGETVTISSRIGRRRVVVDGFDI